MSMLGFDKPLRHRSPDGRRVVELRYESEIRFGPPFYRLFIDGHEVEGRVFGAPIAWSDDARFLATQEWLSTEECSGPRTRLLLFDLERSACAAFRVVEQGFVDDFAFGDTGLVYVKSYSADGNRVEVEVDFGAIRNWQALP